MGDWLSDPAYSLERVEEERLSKVGEMVRLMRAFVVRSRPSAARDAMLARLDELERQDGEGNGETYAKEHAAEIEKEFWECGWTLSGEPVLAGEALRQAVEEELG